MIDDVTRVRRVALSLSVAAVAIAAASGVIFWSMHESEPIVPGARLTGLRCRRRRKPLIPRHNLRHTRIQHVVGRHDLHAIFIEDILDVRVQGVEHLQPCRLVLQTDEQPSYVRHAAIP